MFWNCSESFCACSTGMNLVIVPSCTLSFLNMVLGGWNASAGLSVAFFIQITLRPVNKAQANNVYLLTINPINRIPTQHNDSTKAKQWHAATSSKLVLDSNAATHHQQLLISSN